MRRILVTAGLALCGLSVLQADPPKKPKVDCVVNDWTLIWDVAKEGDCSMEIQVDPESARVVLKTKAISPLVLSSVDAKAVGEALQNTSAVYARLKKAGKGTEKVDGKSHTLTFSISDTGAFGVRIADKKSMGLASAILDRKAAIAFAPKLADADHLVECARAKVVPD